MKVYAVLMFVIGILIVLFLSLYNLFKFVFLSAAEGIEENILTSPPTSAEGLGAVFLSAILAGLLAVVIIIFVAAGRIIRRKRN